jgi:hypothetical protein
MVNLDNPRPRTTMTNRNQMDDIQYRLEAIKENYPKGTLKEWQLKELIADCEKLRLEDPEGKFAGAQVFIESMLNMVLRNLSSLRTLRGIQANLTS